MHKTIDAWHFLQDDRKLRWGDDQEPVTVGKIYKVNARNLELCSYGLHASVKAQDALSFAPGSVICRVRLSGKILEADDKLCASKREVLWMADATRTLHEFACWSAEQTVHLCGDDPRPKAAIQAKRDWLDGKITDKELAAARAAAGDAAGDAARNAAWDASGYAAWAAARDAAGDAAWAAAWDAAWDAAGDAAGDAQEKQLTTMLMALAPKESPDGR